MFHIPDTLYKQIVDDVGNSAADGLAQFQIDQSDNTIESVLDLAQFVPDGMTATGRVPVGKTQRDGVDFGRIFYNLKTGSIEYTDNMSDPTENG